MTRSRSAYCAVTLLVLLGAPRVASANGRFPASGLIVEDPSDPTHILVRSTYGFLVTHNAGAAWNWICEAAVGFGNYQDPFVSIAQDGSIVAGIFTGLSVSHDSGCTWASPPGGPPNAYIVDLATDRTNAAHIVALSSNTINMSVLTQLWQTTDNGATWAQAGTNLPTGLLGLTVDLAPSDPSTVYVSGQMPGPDYAGVIERSTDGGTTWVTRPIPGTGQTALPYIGAIDPTNPDRIYARIDATPNDSAIVSSDGGMTWTTIFQSADSGAGMPGTDLVALALSPDGSMLALGGSSVGTQVAPTSTFAFKQVNPAHPQCLTWTNTGLYACGLYQDGFSVGLSHDQGVTFQPIMQLQTDCGPLPCGAATSVGQQCGAYWPAVAATLDPLPCGADAGVDAGAGVGPDAGDAGPTTTAHAVSSGCGCEVAAGRGAVPAACASMAALLLAALRRRRRLP